MPWQPTALLFPDVELVLTARLRSLINARTESYTDDVYISNRAPEPKPHKAHPERLVIVRRDGGAPGEFRDVTRVSFRVTAQNERAANDLARLVVALLLGIPDGDPIVRVEIQSGPTPIADSSHLRYIVADVHTRAATFI